MFASVRAGEHFAPLVAVCKASSVKARCTSNGTPSALNAGGGGRCRGVHVSSRESPALAATRGTNAVDMGEEAQGRRPGNI